MATLLLLFFSTCRSNIIASELGQWLIALFQQAKFWVPWDQKLAFWTFFKPNNDELVFIEMKQVVHCILCHSIPLDVHVLESKTQSRKK
jgi:hypothetical protein